MEAKVKRRYKGNAYTIGDFIIDAKKICDCLEDKDRYISSDMVESQVKRIKVYGETAIPYGRYRIDMNTYSPKFAHREWAKKYKGKVPRLLNVTGFDGVLLHPGNTPNETLGCILPGFNKEKGKVINSLSAFYTIMDEYFIPAYKRGEEIWITVEP